MAEYKIYSLDAEGKIVTVQELEAWTDDEAILKARTMQGLRKCEVWQGNRLVAAVSDFAQLA